jgi:peptide/nickel transport system permease protein
MCSGERLMRYLLHRTLHAVFLLFGVSLLTFLFSALTPGNYFDDMRLNPQIAPETVAALRAQYQLDRPLPVRYLHWLNAVAHGKLGFSFAYNSPVAPLLWVRARNTLLLTVTAMLLTWALGLPLGVWSAARLGHAPDRILSSVTATLLVVPDLVLALGLLILAVRTGWFPTGGMISVGFDDLSPFQKFRDLATHMTLPVIALALAALPTIVRHVRASVAEVLDAAFLRAARSHGIPDRKLLTSYALRAAANPLISLFGFSVGTLLSGSLLVEVVMSWPGLGPLLLEAILARDLFVVIGGVLLSMIFLVGGNLFADVLLYWADPRIRVAASAK